MKYFCLTLQTTPDRTEHAKSQFSTFNMDVEFFYGIDGNKLGLTDKKLSAGQVGCYVSHLSLWQYLSSFDDDRYIIFEDDIAFAGDFPKMLAERESYLPDDWEYVFLGYEGLEGFPFEKINEYVLRCFPYCTYAYMLKQETVSKLIEASYPMEEPIDLQLQKVLGKSMKTYIIHPKMVYQKSTSNIHSICTFPSLTTNSSS